MKLFLRGMLLSALVMTGLAIGANAKDGGEILGVWKNAPGPHQGFFEIYRTGDRFEGKIVDLAELTYEKGDPEEGKTKHDRYNPEKSLQERPIIGMVFLKDFTYDGDNKYSGGTIYDPESGKTYKCKMTLKGDQLDVRGYVGISMFGRTESWTRDTTHK